MEWENPEVKESHEGKPLKIHIKEVKDILSDLLDFYGFPEEFRRIANYIAEFHDYGKLSKDWSIKKDRKPSHSLLSVQYLIESRELFKERKELTLILWYLILKHHSPLTKVAKEASMEFIIEDTEKRLELLDFEYKINLIDAFGLFKIADACSAKNERIRIGKPKISEDYVKKVIGKEIDERRWEEQRKLIQLPDIALLRAYTGWGKTDSSLLFFVNKDVKKVFFLFPTITAINKFYEKLQKVFNDDVIKYFYFYDTEIKEDLDAFQNLFFAEHFMRKFVITTIDQFLLSFLQVGKYYGKRVMFRNSGIIVDEVHLLNPMILHLLTYFIKKFSKVYDFKILFMSATLPKALKEFLHQKLSLSENSFLDFSNGYERKRRVQFEFVEKDLEESVEEIVEEFKKGKKVLVVVNTVEKAIKVTEKLRELGIKENELVLLHARHMYKHRRSKERKIDELKDTPHILVTTQVCEVSLDISYDFLFTELSPISSLIQRFGRVNRYGEIVKKTNVKIFKPEIKDERHYPYTTESLDTAKRIVKELEEERLVKEKDLLEKLDETYTYEDFIKELNREKRNINLDAFEKVLKFFFSFDIKEEELLEILRYRDSFTTLVIPDPENISDSELKRHLEKLLEKEFKDKTFDERRLLFAEFKELAVPVPIWWLKGKIEEGAFPVVSFRDKVYDTFYGLRSIRGEII